MLTNSLQFLPDAVVDTQDGIADLRTRYKEEIAFALDLVCRDSRLAPERYLQETTVPHGGE